ncbi:hypothetical protein SMICM304S_01176 [Streptomyces microflavus]
MERATGDYLIFLDGDDTLLPEALRASPTGSGQPVTPMS